LNFQRNIKFFSPAPGGFHGCGSVFFFFAIDFLIDLHQRKRKEKGISFFYQYQMAKMKKVRSTEF
jgi:hypothetical protein